MITIRELNNNESDWHRIVDLTGSRELISVGIQNSPAIFAFYTACTKPDTHVCDHHGEVR